jgi:hypothetical protein
VLGLCRRYVGTVTSIRHEDDGDFHVDVRPATRGYARYLDRANYREQHGALVTEIMPGQRLPVPHLGEHVAVFGTWVYDSLHGWNEIHPIWAIRYLHRHRTVRRLPPRRPRYDPDAEPRHLRPAGGRRRRHCDRSYPTVCIRPPPPDRDCPDVPYRNFKVVGRDPHGFDGDGDGVGCEG